MSRGVCDCCGRRAAWVKDTVFWDDEEPTSQRMDHYYACEECRAVPPSFEEEPVTSWRRVPVALVVDNTLIAPIAAAHA